MLAGIYYICTKQLRAAVAPVKSCPKLCTSSSKLLESYRHGHRARSTSTGPLWASPQGPPTYMMY